MKEKIIYEYCVLRYVADVEREEFVNVGLMMMSKRWRWMRCDLNVDEERIKGFCRGADPRRLSTQLILFTHDDVPAPDLSVEERYRWLAAVKSAIIQTSPSHPAIIPVDSPDDTQLTRESAIRLLEDKFLDLFHRLIL